MEAPNQASMIELMKAKKEMGGLYSHGEVGFPKTNHSGKIHTDFYQSFAGMDFGNLPERVEGYYMAQILCTTRNIE